MEQPKKLVFKYSWWKKFWMSIGSLLFFSLCAMVLWGKLTSPYQHLQWEDFFIALGMLLFGTGTLIFPFKSRTVIVADTEGLTPMSFLQKKYHAKIPWDQISQIVPVIQENPTPVFTNRQTYLGLRLKYPEQYANSRALNKLAAKFSTITDAGEADLYIPLMGLDPEKVAEALRPYTQG